MTLRDFLCLATGIMIGAEFGLICNILSVAILSLLALIFGAGMSLFLATCYLCAIGTLAVSWIIKRGKRFFAPQQKPYWLP